MCGVFGLVYPTAIQYNQQKFIEQATFTGTLRGVDSTGLALVDKDNNVDIFKRALSGPDFAGSIVGQRAFDQLKKSFIVIGHNRAATRGVVKDHTAHPFTFGSVTGCHNGTLEYSSGLKVHKHPVDSMNLLDALSQVGDSPSAKQLAEFLETVRGSFALTWYDAATEMMWFARNGQRPLSYFENKKGLFWASEIGMLGWLGQRNSLVEKISDLKVLAPNKLVGYNTREMAFTEEAKFEDPKVVTSGRTYQGGTSGGARGSARNDPIYYFAPEFGERVRRVDYKKAIEEKLWNDEDKEVFLVFDPKKNQKSGASHGLVGTAYLSQGEKVPFVCYGKDGEFDLDTIYTGEVASITITEKDKTVIPRIVIHAFSMDALDEDATTLAASLEEEAVFDLSLPHGGYTFREGDGDQGETAATEDEDFKEQKGKDKVVSLPPPKKADKKEEVKEGAYGGTFRGPFNSYVSGEMFDELVSGNCSHCNGIVTRADAEHMGWIMGKNGSRPVCPDCIDMVNKNAEAYGIRDGELLVQ